ncbi:hypothetical protein GQR58_007034 [Nymphon striatum]|nr:hypothetical protein GQR58_007034 [Nymphon striatum]
MIGSTRPHVHTRGEIYCFRTSNPAGQNSSTAASQASSSSPSILLDKDLSPSSASHPFKEFSTGYDWNYEERPLEPQIDIPQRSSISRLIQVGSDRKLNFEFYVGYLSFLLSHGSNDIKWRRLRATRSTLRTFRCQHERLNLQSSITVGYPSRMSKDLLYNCFRLRYAWIGRCMLHDRRCLTLRPRDPHYIDVTGSVRHSSLSTADLQRDLSCILLTVYSSKESSYSSSLRMSIGEQAPMADVFFLNSNRLVPELLPNKCIRGWLGFKAIIPSEGRSIMIKASDDRRAS